MPALRGCTTSAEVVYPPAPPLHHLSIETHEVVQGKKQAISILLHHLHHLHHLSLACARKGNGEGSGEIAPPHTVPGKCTPGFWNRWCGGAGGAGRRTHPRIAN